MDYQAIIGLEIHVEMKTKSKMFSSAPVSFGNSPNTQVDIFDIAFPGSMPTVNKQAVINGIRLAHALNMDIDDTIIFERKNYFYSDLPRGYQLTQKFRPLGSNGKLTIKTSDGVKEIGVERLHLEEDTCKQIHEDNYSYLDYNRAGIPLVEIVSNPDIRTGEEASKFVEVIRQIVIYLCVSDGKMEEGSIRCDVNISLKSLSSDVLGDKVEIKNLNSLSNIRKAVEYEINRQKEILSKGGHIKQETRRYDETNKKTVVMRIKTESVDYKYFTEPNIPPIKLSQEFINDAIKTSPELAFSRVNRYKMLGLSEYDAELLTSSKEMSDYYDEALDNDVNPKLLANWLLVDVRSYLNKNNCGIDNFPISPKDLAKLVKIVEENIISNKQAKVVFANMIEENISPDKIIQKLGLTQESDEKVLLTLINELLDANPELIVEYKNGKGRVVSFFIGQIMKKMNGKANPSLTSKLLIEEINRR